MGPQNAQPGQPAMPPGAAPAGQAPSQVDPKMVEMYRRVVVAAGKTVYNPKVSTQLVAMVRQMPGNPLRGAALAALTVLDQLRERTKGINPDFVYLAGPIVVAEVLELAAAAKVVPQSPGLIQKAVAILQQEIMKRSAGRGTAAPAGAAPAPAPAASAMPAPAAPRPSGV